MRFILMLLLFPVISFAAITNHGVPATPSADLIRAENSQAIAAASYSPYFRIGCSLILVAVAAASVLIITGVSLWRDTHPNGGRHESGN